MQGRELGCKTLGCGTAVLIVLLSFYGMLAATQKIAEKAKARQAAKASQTAAANLQGASFAVASYVAANAGKLPPTTNPEAFRAALAPRFLSDVSVLSDPATGAPFAPNPQVSQKKRAQVAGAYLLAAAPDKAGFRLVLFADGTVRTVGIGEWQTLTAPRTPPPAPVAPSVPVPSPAQSPR